jgi:hypothetical protein
MNSFTSEARVRGKQLCNLRSLGLQRARVEGSDGQAAMRVHLGCYSPLELRRQALQRVRQECEGYVLTHSYEPEYLYEYLLRQTCGLQLQCSTYAGILQPVQIELLCEVMMADLRRLNTYAALVAWLSIDGFCWQEFLRRPEVRADALWRRTAPEWVPEDLAYGLVLQYPEGVLRMATHVLGLVPDVEVRECLGEEMFADCRRRIEREMSKYVRLGRPR